ncbi:MAG: fimbrial protein [Neisseria sp.]|nr:fimbrial protein [Neisseria sp.]
MIRQQHYRALIKLTAACCLSVMMDGAQAEVCCTITAQASAQEAYTYPLHQAVTPALITMLNPTGNAMGRAISSGELNTTVPGWDGGTGGYRIEFTPALPAAPVSAINTTLTGAFSNQSIGNLSGSTNGNYQVFQTGIDGIGVIFRLAADMHPDAGGSAQSYAVANASTRQIYRPLGTTWTLTTVYRADLGVQAALVKIPRTSYNPSSDTAINRTITLGRFNIYKQNFWTDSQRAGTLEIPVQLQVRIDLRPKTCSLSSASNQTIDLGMVKVSEFPTVNSVMQKNTNSATFDLNCPADYPITVKAVVSDSNNPANTSGDILTLGGSSTASGVGVQLLKDGVPVPLGTDSPAPLPAGDARQWLIGSGTGQRSVTFTARYIRTGTITPGTVQAQAGITFSYQ